MSEVNTINDTIEISRRDIRSVYLDLDGIATLNLADGRTVVTTEDGTELLEGMQLISESQADSLARIISESKENSGPKIALIFEQ